MKKWKFNGFFGNMLKQIPNKIIEKAYDLSICFGVTSWGIWYSDNREVERLRKENALLENSTEKANGVSKKAVSDSGLSKKDSLDKSKECSNLKAELAQEKANSAAARADHLAEMSDLRRQLREEANKMYNDHIKSNPTNSNHSSNNEATEASFICQSPYDNLNTPVFKLAFLIFNWYICFSPLINCQIRDFLWGKNGKPF
jgi:ribosomal protein L29